MTDSSNREERFREILSGLPDKPGVYKFVGKNGKFLYIGKAKSLSKRVRSYFTGVNSQSFRIKTMVDKAVDINFTITNSESEALLLENNLIKQHLPKYNINLKDGKSYPYICIKNERFPRVFPTRKKIQDGSVYFGPYASVKTLNSILELIRQNFKVRTCNYNLSAENIEAGKFKICLEYQIGNCLGPCEGLQEEEEYNSNIKAIRKILKGSYGGILGQLKKEMDAAAADYDFETAEAIKQRIDKINLHKRNNIFSEKLKKLEVVTVATMKDLACITHFKVENGTIVQTHSYESRLKNEESKPEILAAAISKLVAGDGEFAKEVLVNLPVSEEEVPAEIKVTVPSIGEKKRLIELGLKNCHILLEEKVVRQNFRQRIPNREALEGLQESLHMQKMPMHIECFDNSNLQGSQPVASLVVFKNGKASKKDYRHFNIKTVEGANDFASMEEVVHRRYRRLLDEDTPLPDLVLVDGGKGQLSSAASALERLGILRQVVLVGIAKKLEEIYVLNDPLPLHIDKRSPALKLIQQIRNEAHRFAIEFHRNKRSKEAKGTALTGVAGIGDATAKALLKEFRSIKKIKDADPAEIEKLIGKKKTEVILEAIKKGEL